MEILGIMSDLASFGAAGIMGAMWLAERKLSRTRERELTAAHQRIERDEQRLAKFMEVVERNTAAITRFTLNQRELIGVLSEFVREMKHERKI